MTRSSEHLKGLAPLGEPRVNRPDSKMGKPVKKIRRTSLVPVKSTLMRGKREIARGLAPLGEPRVNRPDSRFPRPISRSN